MSLENCIKFQIRSHFALRIQQFGVWQVYGPWDCILVRLRAVNDLPLRLLDLNFSSYLESLGLILKHHLRASYLEIEVRPRLIILLRSTLNVPVFILPLLEATIKHSYVCSAEVNQQPGCSRGAQHSLVIVADNRVRVLNLELSHELCKVFHRG